LTIFFFEPTPKSFRRANARLDVLAQDTPNDDAAILSLDNVILSPHALCWTSQCMAGNGAADFTAVQAVMSGRPPAHVVNLAALESPEIKKRLFEYAKQFGP
jgi:phosphoglycerate dehydrogenase-like enzyme